MRKSIHVRAVGLAMLAPLAMAACDAAGNPTASNPDPGAPLTSASCQAAVTVDLAVGGTQTLTSEQAQCFRLAPHSGARYALAAFDARAVDAARSGPESGGGADPVYSLGDGSSASPVVLPSTSRAAASRPALDFTIRTSSSAPEGDPFARATPWAVGERFPIRRKDREETATARVVRVYGRYVFAQVEGDAGSAASKVIDDSEKAMEFMQAQGFALLDRVFGDRRPATSDGSGQLLVVFASWNPDQGAGGATTRALPDGSGVSTYLWINLDTRSGVRDGWGYTDYSSYRLKVLAHELTHAWQMRYAYETQNVASRSVSFGPAWSMEGTADLLAVDLVRRSLGVSLTANWDWAAQLRTDSKQVTYALEPADTRGRLARGYFDASSFLRDVQVRLTRAGLAADDALGEVARGAVEGWYGIDGAGVRRRGLADRVRAALGAGWEPADAVLLWTVSQALDDDTDVPALGNPVYRAAADGDYGWKPVVDDVRAGSAFSYEFQRAAGSSFFVRLKDDGRGGTVSARTATEGTRWMIARGR